MIEYLANIEARVAIRIVMQSVLVVILGHLAIRNRNMPTALVGVSLAIMTVDDLLPGSRVWAVMIGAGTLLVGLLWWVRDGL